MTWVNYPLSYSWEDVQTVLQHYEQMGPVPGIFVPFLEAFLPILPLIAILLANVNAYGLWEGALLSWIGVVAGAVCVFLLSRKFGGRFGGYITRKYAKADQFVNWLDRRGFTLIFVLACFPFTPSSFVNIISGISKLPIHTFITATALGKGVMIILVAIAGYDLGSLLQKPWKIVLMVFVFLILWLVGRKLESKYIPKDTKRLQ